MKTTERNDGYFLSRERRLACDLAALTMAVFALVMLPAVRGTRAWAPHSVLLRYTRDSQSRRSG